ncbi:hypothetical protein CHS0354_020927 [Potamilus streckersoni]|uniref:Uncharacterized protein n=1 Tax=Potamilus streckersoni TaxID=2493646 RepID=A0AAE0TA91_9BIVA|nr:hypothetical protein CHS0354_020927 [Potamilus streckersoni]
MEQQSPRSYVVDVNGHLYRRNRKYIRTTSEAIPEPMITDPSVFNDQKCVKKPAYEEQSASESIVKSSKNTATSEEVNMEGESSQCTENSIHVESSPKPKAVSGHSVVNIENSYKSTRTRNIKPPKKYEDFV